MSLVKKPIFWLGAVTLLGAGFVLTAPPESSASSAKRTASTRKKSSKKGKFDFSAEDFKAKFDPVATNVRDVFKPVVFKGGTGESDGVNVILSRYAGGEKGWVYTGSAEVSGVKSALLENRTTGEGVFLKLGQSWKGSTVVSIANDSIILSNDGSRHTFRLAEEEQVSAPSLASNVKPMAVDVPQTMRGNLPQLPSVSAPGMPMPGASADNNSNNNTFTPIPIPGGDQ